MGSGGGLGHLGVQFAKSRNLTVVAIDARDEGLALSKEMGADVVLDAREGKDAVVGRVKEVTGGKMADATVNYSDADAAAAVACAVTRVGGTMVQVAQVSTILDILLFIFYPLHILFSPFLASLHAISR